MRELKFRAWLKNIKKMTDVTWFSDKEVNCNYVPLPKRDDVILMQFTGLKDISGKEIYEGDIIKHPDALCYCVITYEDTQAEFMALDDENMGYSISYDMDLDVIGNIYENFNLL